MKNLMSEAAERKRSLLGTLMGSGGSANSKWTQEAAVWGEDGQQERGHQGWHHGVTQRRSVGIILETEYLSRLKEHEAVVWERWLARGRNAFNDVTTAVCNPFIYNDQSKWDICPLMQLNTRNTYNKKYNT